MTALAVLLLLAGPARPDDARPHGAQVIRLTLAPARPDHFLPPPRLRRVRLDIDARRAPAKARVMFTAPLPPGQHHLHLRLRGSSPGRTLVVAVPLSGGRSSITVRIDGPGRFDFGFFNGDPRSPPKEYRYTVEGPLPQRTFEVELPVRTGP